MKTCTKCNVDKPYSEFSKKRTKKNGEVVLQYHCKTCQKQHSRKNYERNQDKYISSAKKRKNDYRDSVTQYIVNYLSEHSCTDCGESDPLVLDFDHVAGNKTDDISRMVARGFSLDIIVDEIKKCEVRCANCHRRVTAQRGGWRILKFLP